eukprot:jgi/Antlo1/7/2027
MIAAIFLLSCSVQSLNSEFQTQVHVFSTAYTSYGSPDEAALVRRRKGLNEILDAMEKIHKASDSFSSCIYDRGYIGYALIETVEWGFIAPLASFVDQFEDFNDAQKAAAAELLRILLSPGVVFPYSSKDNYYCMLGLPNIRERRVSIFEKALHFVSEVICYLGTYNNLSGEEMYQKDKHWYRELLYRIVEKKEAYYNALIGFFSENEHYDVLDKCFRKINVRDIMDDIIGFVLVCIALDSESNRSFTTDDRPIMYSIMDLVLNNAKEAAHDKP